MPCWALFYHRKVSEVNGFAVQHDAVARVVVRVKLLNGLFSMEKLEREADVIDLSLFVCLHRSQALHNMGALLLPLPHASSPTLRLAHATPAQKLVQALETSAVWRGPLSVAAYLRREKYLANQALTVNLGITHWVLVDSAEPEGSRRVLCSCESIRKRAIVARGGKAKDAISHCVTNVFCPPQHSRRGYARRMMKELGSVLGTYQTEETAMESLFSALWSDIGKIFYAEHGWEPFPSSHICIPAVQSPAPVSFGTRLPRRLKLLRASDIESLCAADEEGLRKALSARPASSPPAICLVPDHQIMSWHHAREDFIATELHGRAPEIKGALVSGSAPGQRAWCYWTLMWHHDPSSHQNGPPNNDNNNNTLHLLRLVVEKADVQSIEALLRAAQLYAGLWKMGSVQFWNPTPKTVEAARRIDIDAQVVDRDEQSISSVKWFGSDEDKVGMEWVGNEKYAWC